MSINCEIILRWGATPDQLTALGAALWRWCTREAGDASIYQYLDNQGLADLMAGKFPASGPSPPQAERRGVYFRVRDEASHDRQSTIDALRHDIPTAGIEDILVAGTSWNPAKSTNLSCVTLLS